ncbi:MAG: ATP-binding protein [Rhodoferax sp.]
MPTIFGMSKPRDRKRLPIGIQTFREIREEGHYYVDKTGFCLRLIDEGKYYFLSRPRRFGKSLLIDTLAELFAGNQTLFEGLYCFDRWDWSLRFPVIRISFGGGVLRSRAELDAKIRSLLRINQEALGLRCADPLDVVGCFSELIRSAHLHTGQRAVVLVDEYDKPLLDNLDRPDTARELREGLRNFYSVIKDSDAHIRFAMLTGVSKFSKVSLFSGLNNLKDITLDARYSALCGYTDADLDTVFAPELPGLDRDEIRRWYNGYNWLGESVYNPFDVLLLLDSHQFRPYWFETATPKFLIDALTRRHTFTPELDRLVTADSLLSTFDVDHMPIEALMFQAGYLTIGDVWSIPGRQEFTLRYPNLEVRASLNDSLLQALSGDPALPGRSQGKLYRLLLANDFGALQTLFTAFYASIPHQWLTNNPIAQYEGYYASLFYSYFAALGLDVTCEESSNAGRLDMALRFNNQVYLFEFKVVELEPEGRALQQIIDKGYAEPYKASAQPIHLIGVEFSSAQRKVVGFEVQTLLNS